MPTFIVTTEEDVVDADDGLLSLREAVELTRQNDFEGYVAWLNGAPYPDPIDDVIRFAEGIETVKLDGRDVDGELIPNPLRTQNFINAGILIDGDTDGDGLGDVTIDGQGRTSHFQILEHVTLRNLTLANGLSDRRFENEVDGFPGSFGTDVAGAVEVDEAGKLTLERVGFVNNRAYASDGEDGRDGDDGTPGWGDGPETAAGAGRDAFVGSDGDLNPFNNPIFVSTAGNPGGDGTDGGAGGDGGRGGHAAGAILNRGELILRDVWFSGDNWGQGGDGGDPGLGGRGGDGQNGGRGGEGRIVQDTVGSPGGRGGDAGSGGLTGRTGSGGDAAHLILHDGTALIVEGLIAVEDLPPGVISQQGEGFTGGWGPGDPGDGGPGGRSTIGSAADGPDGGFTEDRIAVRNPFRFANSEIDWSGEHERVLFVAPTASDPIGFQTVAVLIEAAFQDADRSEGEAVRFLIRARGETDAPLEVDWRFEGAGAAAFADADRSGTAVIGAEAEEVEVQVATAVPDGVEQGPRTLRLVLGEIRGLSGAESVDETREMRILDAEAPPVPEPDPDPDPGPDPDPSPTPDPTPSPTPPDDTQERRVSTDGDDRMRGTPGRDDLAGGGGDDVIRGLAGADRLRGQAGDDRLFGQGGRDRLDGGAGRDRLDGGSGRDRLDGGAGRDLLEGGRGRDQFRFDRGDGRDVIEDFGGRDLIVFRSGAERFGDLRLRDRGEDAIIRYEGGRILVEDAAGELGRGDFVFA